MDRVLLLVLAILLSLGANAKGSKLGAIKVSITGSIVSKDSIDDNRYESSLVITQGKFGAPVDDEFEFRISDERGDLSPISTNMKFKAIVTKDGSDTIQWVSPVVETIDDRKVLEFRAENGGVVKKFDKPLTIVQYFN